MLGYLTAREMQVLRLLVLGYTNTQISKMLYITYSTVKAHVQAILYKFNVKNRIQAAVIAANFLQIQPEMVVETAKTFKRKNGY